MKKVAVIGLGSIASRHRRNLKLLFPKVSLLAMSASGRVPTDKVSDTNVVTTNINELIEFRPEIVIVASPAPFHASHAIPLIEAGIPTLIEKPVTSSIKDCAALEAAISNSLTQVTVGYCLRYLPSSLKMKQLLESKVIGNVYNAFIEIGQYLPDWRPNKNYLDSVSANKHLGGGALLELSHELDYAQWLLGDFQLEHAILRSTSELNLKVEDIADITLKSELGTICNIHLDFLKRSVQRKCSFIGSTGRLDWDLITNTVTLSDSNNTTVIYSDPSWDKNKMYLEMVMDFVDKINGNTNNCIELDQATKTIKLIEQIKLNANWSK